MPYRKSYQRKRRAPRRRTNRKRAPAVGYLNTASKALSIATRVASMVNAEKFHFDALNNITITAAAQIFPLQLIPEGDDTQTRTGRSIKLAGLDIKWLFLSAVAATGDVNARVMFFIDWWSNGAIPVVTDLLVSGVTTSFRQVDTVSSKRFQVIYDKVFTLTPYGGNRSAFQLNRFMHLKHHLKYINTTGVQAATGSGQVYALILADSVATNAATALLQTRSFYYDN